MTTMIILRGLTGELRGQEFAFPGPTQAILGRSRSCALRLPGDATVSRQHCLLELDDVGVWVQDLGSLNGTHVNGEKIGQRNPAHNDDDATLMQPARHALQDGDELRVCNNLFAVCFSEAEVTNNDTVGADRSSGEWRMALSV